MLYIKRKQIRENSKGVKSYGYRAGNLDIEFANGTIYRYFFTPKKVVRGIKETKSVGRYIIKKVLGKYPFKRLV